MAGGEIMVIEAYPGVLRAVWERGKFRLIKQDVLFFEKHNRLL